MLCWAEGYEPIPGYCLQEHLGEGGFGEVWRSTAPGGGDAALKLIKLSGTPGRKELSGVGQVKNIRHPNLIHIAALWMLDKRGNVLSDQEVSACHQDGPYAGKRDAHREESLPAWLVLAMDLGSKNLADRLRECQNEGVHGIPAEELLRYMDDAAKGIDFLNSPRHDLGTGRPVSIQHRDIKPANIMLVGDAAVVCDFGLARVLARTVGSATCLAGTAAYIPPECIGGQLSQASDQYSLAITYVELRTGRLPFSSETYEEVLNSHLKGFLDLSRLSPLEARVIRRATALKPARRYDNTRAMVGALRQAVEKSSKSGAARPGAFLKRLLRLSDTTVPDPVAVTPHVQGDTLPEKKPTKTKWLPAKDETRPGTMVATAGGLDECTEAPSPPSKDKIRPAVETEVCVPAGRRQATRASRRPPWLMLACTAVVIFGTCALGIRLLLPTGPEPRVVSEGTSSQPRKTPPAVVPEEEEGVERPEMEGEGTQPTPIIETPTRNDPPPESQAILFLRKIFAPSSDDSPQLVVVAKPVIEFDVVDSLLRQPCQVTRRATLETALTAYAIQINESSSNESTIDIDTLLRMTQTLSLYERDCPPPHSAEADQVRSYLDAQLASWYPDPSLSIRDGMVFEIGATKPDLQNWYDLEHCRYRLITWKTATAESAGQLDDIQRSLNSYDTGAVDPDRRHLQAWVYRRRAEVEDNARDNWERAIGSQSESIRLAAERGNRSVLPKYQLCLAEIYEGQAEWLGRERDYSKAKDAVNRAAVTANVLVSSSELTGIPHEDHGPEHCFEQEYHAATKLLMRLDTLDHNLSSEWLAAGLREVEQDGSRCDDVVEKILEKGFDDTQLDRYRDAIARMFAFKGKHFHEKQQSDSALKAYLNALLLDPDGVTIELLYGLFDELTHDAQLRVLRWLYDEEPAQVGRLQPLNPDRQNWLLARIQITVRYCHTRMDTLTLPRDLGSRLALAPVLGLSEWVNAVRRDVDQLTVETPRDAWTTELRWVEARRDYVVEYGAAFHQGVKRQIAAEDRYLEAPPNEKLVAYQEFTECSIAVFREAYENLLSVMEKFDGDYARSPYSAQLSKDYAGALDCLNLRLKEVQQHCGVYKSRSAPAELLQLERAFADFAAKLESKRKEPPKKR